MKKEIQIIWFKRDLRTQDHAPLWTAAQNSIAALAIYVFEPEIMEAQDHSERHLIFVCQSIRDLRKKLPIPLLLFFGRPEQAFGFLQNSFTIKQVLSYQETGNRISFDRDKRVAHFFKSESIEWLEFPSNGVIRGIKNRKNWSTSWMETMKTLQFPVDLKLLVPVLDTIIVENTISGEDLFLRHLEEIPGFQRGGESEAMRYMESFFEERYVNYIKHISKPAAARKGCSRLSPFLAYGNLSIRQIFQKALFLRYHGGKKRELDFFIARLQWHCHFIQKFESECEIEFTNLNKGFDDIRTEVNALWVDAWKRGMTGIPMVDACMRCVVATGYLNFRMRSMLVSFLTHHLFQPWQSGVHHLAKAFLDYEPGIHFPQFQMQAGTMGVNTIRIYNPIKQGLEHDPEGEFIRMWVKELSHLPPSLVHEPWKMSQLEQAFYNYQPGITYPHPIVDVDSAAKTARESIWQKKKSKEVKENNRAILQKHTKRSSEQESPLFPMRGE